MFATIESFRLASQPQVELFNAWVERIKPGARADHLCYKCASATEFEQIRALFEAECTFLYQSIISRRRIAVIKFLQPIQTRLGDIWYLELSDQKPDGSQTSGFDHIELYPPEGSLEDLVGDLEAKGVAFEKVIRPHHTTYDSVLAGTFKIRLEAEPLLEKIKRDEMN